MQDRPPDMYVVLPPVLRGDGFHMGDFYTSVFKYMRRPSWPALRRCQVPAAWIRGTTPFSQPRTS